MKKNPFYNKLIPFFTILLSIYYIKSISILNIDILYPVSLTLNNDNILLITSQYIIFFDSSLTIILNIYNLTESEIAKTVEESYKTNACQYSKEYNSYILVFVKDQLYFFDMYGSKLHKENFTEELSEQDYYEIVPIKKEDNNLYYLISFTINKNPLSIKLLYYKMNINTNENILISEKKYIPLTFEGSEFSLISDNVVCQLMNSNNQNNILACFYSGEYPQIILITSFSLENNNIIELSSYSTKILFKEIYYIKFLKVKTIGNRTKAYMSLTIYNYGGYSAIYDINSNNITSIEKKVNFVGTGLKCINFQYFEKTEQFILSFKDNNKEFGIILMDKDFNCISNKNGEQNFIISGIYYNINREAIVYLSKNESYYLISDSIFNGKPGEQMSFIINFTYSLINNSTDYIEDSIDINYDSTQKEIEEEIYEEEKEENKKEERQEEENIEREDIKEEEKEEEYKIEEEYKEEEGKEKSEIIINGKNKCYISSKESKKMNLCIECNVKKGYYPAYFKGYNIFPKGFKECFNNETKLVNLYFNQDKKQYEPCFETCNTCDYGGNEEINNCTSCDVDSIFRPDINDTSNCVKKCRYKYYYTSYGQYKCTENQQCPKEVNLLIKDKNKCIEDCKLDNIYKFQYNGECLKNCPNGTKEKDNICYTINENKCSFHFIENYLKENLTRRDIDLLIKKYGQEFMNINNHISIYKNDFIFLSIYKNKNCIKEFLLNVSEIDFGPCYELIKTNNNINSDLIILIIEKYYNDSSLIFYDFYNPITLEKIDISKECKNMNIIIEKNIKEQLKRNKENIDNIIKLAKQNINIFDKFNEFYYDICFNYESPNGKDIPLKDRLKEFYPNITLCDNRCLYKGVNLTSMSSICQCKFTDFLGDNYFTENAFISKISDEIEEIILQSNILILQCYKDVFTYKYFKENTGGFIILSIIICHSICILIFYYIHLDKVTKYVFILMQTYLSLVGTKNIIDDKSNIFSFLKGLASPNKKLDKNKNEKKIIKIDNKHKTLIYQNNSNIIKLNIKKLEIKKSNLKEVIFPKNSNIIKNSDNINNTYLSTVIRNSQKKLIIRNKKKKDLLKMDNNFNNNELRYKIKKYMKKYLSTDIDDNDFYDAMKLDKRKFCQYLWERIKSIQFILNIIFVNEQLIPRSIKVLLFLMKINLYFLINGLFINEEYISEIYHSNEEWSLWSLLKKTNYNFLYITFIGVFFGYLFTCFFFDEKKIKNIFIRNKNDQISIKNEIYLLIKNIKSNYITLFIINYIILIFSWYFISCFNNVYTYTKKDWIISSISIFLEIQIFYLFFSLFETIIRFLSFKIKSEKLFKISKIFN